MKIRFVLSFVACIFTSFASLNADLIVPSPGDNRFGWSRGETNSFFYGWNVISDEGPSGGPIVDTTPDVAGSSGPGTPSLTETTGLAFVTGGGNIYSFSGATKFVLNAPTTNLGSGYSTRVVAQFRTLGSELDYSSIRLDGFSPIFTEELARTSLGGFGGAQVDYLASWLLPSTTSAFTLTFDALSSSLSLDQVHVDGFASSVSAVPEPSSMALLGIAAASAGYVRRRNRKRLAKDRATAEFS